MGGCVFCIKFLTGADPLGDLALKRMLVQSALDAPLPITFRSHHLATGLSISKNHGVLEWFLGRAMGTSVAAIATGGALLRTVVGKIHSEEGRCASAAVHSLLWWLSMAVFKVRFFTRHHRLGIAQSLSGEWGGFRCAPSRQRESLYPM